jgi:hypothetical protein
VSDTIVSISLDGQAVEVDVVFYNALVVKAVFSIHCGIHGAKLYL